MKTNVQNYNQNQSLITYYNDGSVQINLDCILTRDHIVRPGMLLVKVEGHNVDVVKLLRVRNTDRMVYLQIKDMKTKRVYEISQILDPDEKLFIWWITSYTYVAAALEDRVIEELKGTERLEFDF